ncbi:hypothetical protein Fcan01_19501 [Folsomia candida]|uniref:Uncharacterized protein n=1 Tax=Folsomia candida TaxID=158441 RepID=A0A226DME9_FOLCA|nr:hypothetical protein Fcan01_19501 [Folsomia candida]
MPTSNNPRNLALPSVPTPFRGPCIHALAVVVAMLVVGCPSKFDIKVDHRHLSLTIEIVIDSYTLRCDAIVSLCSLGKALSRVYGETTAEDDATTTTTTSTGTMYNGPITPGRARIDSSSGKISFFPDHAPWGAAQRGNRDLAILEGAVFRTREKRDRAYIGPIVPTAEVAAEGVGYRGTFTSILNTYTYSLALFKFLPKIQLLLTPRVSYNSTTFPENHQHLGASTRKKQLPGLAELLIGLHSIQTERFQEK